jgi:hypothetical protein
VPHAGREATRCLTSGIRSHFGASAGAGPLTVERRQLEIRPHIGIEISFEVPVCAAATAVVVDAPDGGEQEKGTE